MYLATAMVNGCDLKMSSQPKDTMQEHANAHDWSLEWHCV